MVRVGIVDSGGPAAEMADAAAFGSGGGRRSPVPDRLGHGSAVARVILRACPEAAIRHAQVFDARPVTSARRVAAAVDWLAGAGDVDLICLSLGLAANRPELAGAVAQARGAGVHLVAAHPARGPAPYPAAYDGVVAATGDARCGWDQLSALGPRLFGAWCNSPERGGQGMGGASLGTARVAGHVAAMLLAAGRSLHHDALLARLSGCAVFRGRERRVS